MNQVNNFPVDFLPMPEEHSRKAVNDERRRYGRLMGEAALKMKQLHDERFTDKLTGLGNRLLLETHLPHLFEYADAHNVPIGLLYADVRGLKRANDAHGHDMGDKLLQATGKAFGDTVRSDDIAVHLSGDEFITVLVGYAPLEGQTLAELDKSTKSRYQVGFENAAKRYGIPDELHVGLDIGIALRRPDDTHMSLVGRAEQHMNQAKNGFYAALEVNGVILPVDRRLH
jgi:diguanylate cyclase (GGDEF)-like protein